MKRLVSNKWLLGILLVVLILGIGLFTKKDWLHRNYLRIQTQNTVKKELEPLQAKLAALGFTNLSSLQTSCVVHDSNAPFVPPPNAYVIDTDQRMGRYVDCSSAVNQFINVPSDKSAFANQAKELAKVLQANGWESREDYPTAAWFEAISKDVDYQPDQYNHKSVRGWDCILDFTTAFSKPDPAAVNLNMMCSKSIKL